MRFLLGLSLQNSLLDQRCPKCRGGMSANMTTYHFIAHAPLTLVLYLPRRRHCNQPTQTSNQTILPARRDWNGTLEPARTRAPFCQTSTAAHYRTPWLNEDQYEKLAAKRSLVTAILLQYFAWLQLTEHPFVGIPVHSQFYTNTINELFLAQVMIFINL